MPNGQAVGSDKYAYKLDWLSRFEGYLAGSLNSHPQLAVLGDYNIAPADIDVHDPRKFVDATHVSPDERARFTALLDWGLVDVFRQLHPHDERVFSWWDYRGGDFHQGRGMRIDHLLCSQAVADDSRWCLIDRNARKGTSPSDHAPVVLDVDV